MKILLLCFVSFACLTGSTLAAPSAEKGAVIFSDDFNRAELGAAWRVLHPECVLADGALKISQVKEHSAVGMVKVGAKDVTVEFRFRLGGATSINAVFNDRDFKEGHGGHLARVSLSPRQIFLADDKERLRHEIEEMRKDPKRKAEATQLTAGRSVGFPIKLDPTRWYQLAITVLGEEMRVSLDGKNVGSLKSSGIAHPVKSDFYFSVSGKDALFDDLRIGDAASAN
ncbi:MAG TPA: hypothetical protein VI454_04270 [Verrucomicrobiae bacterium]